MGCLVAFSCLVLALRILEVSTILSAVAGVLTKIRGVSLGLVLKMRASGIRQ
jgi:hypothetical protein